MLRQQLGYVLFGFNGQNYAALLEILSPTLTFTSFTTLVLHRQAHPSSALSVSSVIRVSSTAMVSPAFVSTAMMSYVFVTADIGDFDFYDTHLSSFNLVQLDAV